MLSLADLLLQLDLVIGVSQAGLDSLFVDQMVASNRSCWHKAVETVSVV